MNDLDPKTSSIEAVGEYLLEGDKVFVFDAGDSFRAVNEEGRPVSPAEVFMYGHKVSDKVPEELVALARSRKVSSDE